VTTAGELRADGPRLLELLRTFATFGADEAGGVTRVGFGAAENAVRRYLASVARDAGLTAAVDTAGNLIIRRDRPVPPGGGVLLMGSHLDSVVNGGRLDGAYGVAAAFETLLVLAEHDAPMRHEPVAIAFANEEGSLFPQPFWGSMAVAGTLTDPAAATDTTGRSIREPLADAGGDLDRITEAVWPSGAIAGYLELHIEQGPVLARQGYPIGVVDGIVGRTVFDIEVLGRQNHAGTTPMNDRTDALVAAARLVLRIREIAAERRACAVSTVGSLTVQPSVTNVVPGQVRLTAEIRDLRSDRLRDAESAVVAELDAVRAEFGVRVDTEVTLRAAPRPTDPLLRAAVADAANHLDLPWLPIASGAGHDAQIIADVAPVGMIFVPSRDGISHAPDEFTEDHHLVAGADVLIQSAVRLLHVPAPIRAGAAR
jgi:N-carbamoyl-L-amino-acid hydrolase